MLGTQLWKALYTSHYLDQRQDNAWFKRDESLPTRTWKDLFRIAHNWRVGRARTTRLPLRSSVLPPISLSTEINDLDDEQLDKSSGNVTISAELSPSISRSAKARYAEHVKVVWHGQFYFVRSEDGHESGLPSVDVFHIEPTSQTSKKVASIISPGLKGKGTPGSLLITEIQLDAAAIAKDSNIRLVVFYSNGQFSLFRVRHVGPASTGETISISEEYFSTQKSTRPTIIARLHSPILVSSSSDCSVRFRFIEERHNPNNGQAETHITVSQPTMRTGLCFAPMSMRLVRRGETLSGFAKLKAEQAPQHFRLSLAYSTPYYPSAFTVGIQIFNITVPARCKSTAPYRRPLEIFARSAIAAPPSHYEPLNPNQAFVNTIEHDGPYIVASKNDNTISVYRVIDRLADSWPTPQSQHNDSPPLSPAKMNIIPLKLQHVRTLFGHTSAVDAVSVLHGRCVSTGKDGIKVWELPHRQASTRPSLHSEDSGSEEENPRWKDNIAISERDSHAPKDDLAVSNSDHLGKCQWIGLDTSRIVTVSQDNDAAERFIKVYHFE